MKKHMLLFVNVLFSMFAFQSVNGQLRRRRRANNNDSNSNENIGSTDPCERLCKNGSTCMEGIAQSPSSVGYDDGDDRAAYHCQCPYGWTGVRCDIVYESCSLDSSSSSSPSESTPHYQHECYNNGACVPGKFDDYGHEQLFCDCSDAFDEDGNMYAGKYCEHQVVDYCSDDEENVCLNGAICNKDYPEFGGPCLCHGDFEGRRCESRKHSVPNSAPIIMQNAPNLAPQCDLTCLNGGHCVMHTTSVRIEDGESEGTNRNTDVIDRISKYCTCPTGYDGPTCEIEKKEKEEDPVSMNDYSSTLDSPSFHDSSPNSFTTVATIDTETGTEITSNQITVVTKNKEVELEQSKCGNGYCAHGSVCVVSSIDDKDSYCDCDTVTTNDASFAGRFCQYEATSYCAKNPGINHHLFCVNDGSCKKDMFDDTNGSIGCDCKNGFMGFHCQMTIEEFTASTLIPYGIDSSTDDDEESNADLQLINEKQGYEDDIKHLSAEGTFDHLDQSVSMPLQSEEEEEIAETLEKNENDATENISTTLEMSGDQSTLSTISNEPPVDDTKKSGLVSPIVDDPAYISEEEYKQTFEKDIIEEKEEEECTGNSCEKINKKLKACGSGYCYNGGTCVKSSIFSGNDNDDQQVYCDCSTATTNEVSYAGRSCQYEATSYCSDDSRLHGHLFCVNGGMCKDNIYKGCDCQDGFGGFSCEFTTSKTYESHTTTTPVDDNEKSVLVSPVVDDPAYIKCDNSKCMNGGICRKGAKQHGSEKISKIVRGIDHLDATYDPKNFDHCVCRPGFTGLRCEHEIQTCNGDDGDINFEEEEHFCLHGSKCIKVTDNENLQQQHGCDCSTTTSNISPVFAGKSCEHKSTSICTKTEEVLPGKPLSFCVNGGSCLKEVSNNESHAGCQCPANWSGPHCELHNDDSNKKDETVEIKPVAETTAILKSSLSEKQDEYDAFSSPSGSSNLKFRILSRFFIVIGSLILVLMMIAYVNKRQQRRKCAKEMKSFLTNNNSNHAHFTDNPSLQTPDNSINLAPKQDYNYDGIPLRPPSVTAIANTHYQPDPVDMIIDSMGKGKGIGMESSDFTPETNQYSTGRNKRGENNNHQIL